MSLHKLNNGLRISLRMKCVACGSDISMAEGKWQRKKISKPRRYTTVPEKQVDVLPSKNQAMCKLNHC